MLDTRYGGPEYGLPNEGTLEAIVLPPESVAGTPDPDFARTEFTDDQSAAAAALKATVAKGDYAVVDFETPALPGADIVRSLRDVCPTTRVLILTGRSRVAAAANMLLITGAAYLSKPADTDEVTAAQSRIFRTA